MKTIMHTLKIHTSPTTVYEALTTDKGLAGWWSEKVWIENGTGGIVRFTFEDEFNPQMRVTELAQDRIVRWQCTGGHDRWQDSKLSFALEEQEGETQLHFVQDYPKDVPDTMYGTYNFNWGYYLNSLKLFCEKGKGTPFSPPE
ncbi:MAG: hypothetical protein GF346_08700 [Candidatus Eisenbacteria bacterium]|nr:hypothetical protein [Candidatus Latescibacterota bacterium]MBD3302514.1 hypothetical protein [Candidatus Eisenbacteria bacterium]